MGHTYVAQSPSDLHDLWPRLAIADQAKISLTLRLYESADIRNEDLMEEGWNPPVIEALYGEWVAALRNADLPHTTNPDAAARAGPRPICKVVFDITRPPIINPSRPNFVPYEAQGLARITNVLRSIFHGQEMMVEATLIGAPCWCLLQEDERNILLPKGQSWPVLRTSHVISATDKGDTCLRLAREHWDDEHWGFEKNDTEF